MRLWPEGDTTNVDIGNYPNHEPTLTAISDYFSVDGRTPSAFPRTKLGLAFLVRAGLVAVGSWLYSYRRHIARTAGA